jgi:site-specific DNA-methyltransferase (cytosine-N4-specific)
MSDIFYKDETGLLLQGDALESLKTLPDESVDFCMTSPPYWGQRSYQEGVIRELGQEANFKDFVTNLANIFDEVRRVLTPTGSMWVIINDTYFSTSKGSGGKGSLQDNSLGSSFTVRKYDKLIEPKSLCNIPYRLAIELTDESYVLRDDLSDDERKFAITELIKRGILK